MVNKANSNDGLVPTNMLLLLPAGTLVTPLHVNVSSRKNCGCRWKGKKEIKCSSRHGLMLLWFTDLMFFPLQCGIKAIRGNEDHIDVMHNHVR